MSTLRKFILLFLCASVFCFSAEDQGTVVSEPDIIQASEFEKFRCGLGGCRCDEQRAPFGTPAETVRRVTDERSEEKLGEQSGSPSGGAVARNNEQPHSTEGEMVSPLTEARSARTGSDSDHQSGVSPYESNPDRDYLAIDIRLTEVEDNLEKLEKEVKQLRQEVDKLNELTSVLRKTLRALEIATQGGSSLRPDMETWNSIRKGMTAEEVQDLLGSPEEIEQRKTGDVWYYYGMGSITFNLNGRVSSQATFKRLPMEHKVR